MTSVRSSTITAAGTQRALQEAEHPVWRPYMQGSFQPGGMPRKFQHRFLMWNSTGIVSTYDNGSDTVLDVEFHNVNVHPSFHRDFSTNYVMADVSVEALALASVGISGEKRSELFVEPFKGLGGKWEWTLEMGDCEDVLCVTLGAGWVAIATSLRLLKVFTLGGAHAMPTLALPGDPVCLLAFGDLIAVVFHRGLGYEDQHLAYMILNVKKQCLIKEHGNFPLDPRAYLSWAGFTDEGSLCSVDSNGVVRLCPQTDKGLWYPVLHMKDLVPEGDNYFVVGLSEKRQTVRGILCRGSMYPLTVPKPTITSLQFKLPVTSADADQAMLQEEFWRSRMRTTCCTNLQLQGVDASEEMELAEDGIVESSMKLFALSCRNDREMFALGFAKLMPTRCLEGALKYASRLKLRHLAEKLGELLRERMDGQLEDDEEILPQDAQVDDRRELWSRAPERDVAMSYKNPGLIPPPKFLIIKSRKDERNNSSVCSEQGDDSASSTHGSANDVDVSNPLLAAAANVRLRGAALDTTRTPACVNPFRSKKDTCGSGHVIGDGHIVFDDLDITTTMASKKDDGKSSAAAVEAKRGSKLVEGKHTKKSKQSTLFASKKEVAQEATSAKKPAFPAWFAERRADFQNEFPDLSHGELIKQGMKRFKEVYLASEPSAEPNGKRKIEEADEKGEADHAVKKPKGGAAVQKGPKPAAAGGKLRFAEFANSDE